jgi:hypothetical protein
MSSKLLMIIVNLQLKSINRQLSTINLKIVEVKI